MKKPLNASVLLILLGASMIICSILISGYENRNFGKIIIQNIGMGLVSVGISFLIGCIIFGIKKFSDLKFIPGISHRWQYYLITNTAWFFLIPAGSLYWNIRAMRSGYPIGSDIISYQISSGQNWVILLSIPLNILLALFISIPQNRTVIFERIRFSGEQRTGIELIFIVFILLTILMNSILILWGDFLSIPAILVLTYVLLSLRAGKIEQIKQTIDERRLS